MANICVNYVKIFSKSNKKLEKIKSIFENIDDLDEIPFYNELMAIETERQSISGSFGTKWINEVELQPTISGLNINACSAWSPFDLLCERITKYFHVKIEIQFHEYGSDIGGCYRYNSKGITYKFDSDYMGYMKKYSRNYYNQIKNEMLTYGNNCRTKNKN